MEPILPNLAALLGNALKVEAPPLRAQVLNLPAQLLQAAAPVSLPGVVAESGIAGQLRITTPIGDVQLRVPTELPVGRAITIVTRPASPGEVFLLPAPVSSPTIQAGVNTSGVVPTPAAPNQSAQSTMQTAPLQSPSAPGRVASSTPGAAMNSVGAAAPSSAPPSGPTLAPSSLLATLETPVLPEPAGRTPYAPPPQANAPSELIAVLTDLRRLVAARDPKLAERLQRRLPTADRSGAVAMLALPVAARDERLDTWLGRDITAAIAEDSNHVAADLLPRLADALTRVEERIEDNGERTWRWRQLPVSDNGQLVMVSIGVPAERAQTEPDGRGRQSRPRAATFAVEVSLSALGMTRVEATYRGRHLDLVVESEASFEPESRAQIADAVGAVLTEFGMSGSCRFAPYRRDPAAAVKV